MDFTSGDNLVAAGKALPVPLIIDMDAVLPWSATASANCRQTAGGVANQQAMSETTTAVVAQYGRQGITELRELDLPVQVPGQLAGSGTVEGITGCNRLFAGGEE